MGFLKVQKMFHNIEYEVVVATYNGEKFLKEQLDSILNQTILPHKIYIRDDCSTDSTVKLLNYYKNIYPNIVLIEGERNFGYVKNFEELSRMITKDFVLFCDQDDIWLTNKAEEMIFKIISSDSDLVFSDAVLINDKAKEFGALWESIGFDGYLNTDVYDYLIQGNVVTGATICCRRDFIFENLPFPREVPHDFWLSIKALSNRKLTPLNKKLTLYRQHENNVIGINSDNGLFEKLSIKSVVKRKSIYKEKEFIYRRFGSEVKYTYQKDYFDFMSLVYDKGSLFSILRLLFRSKNISKKIALVSVYDNLALKYNTWFK